MSRRAAALLIGVNECGRKKLPPLYAPERDVEAMEDVLGAHENLTANAIYKVLSSRKQRTDYETVSKALDDHLGENHELLIIYFAGHAHVTKTDVHLLLTARGIKTSKDLISMRDLLTRLKTTESKILNTVILLDCCYAGASIRFAARPLPPGVTIFAAADAHQEAVEYPNWGKFTRIAADGLRGRAKLPDGSVTVSSLYDYLDRHMSEAGQRPIFATHLSNNIPLRLCTPEPKPEAAPLSMRTAKTLRQIVTGLKDDETIFMVSEDVEAELKRFFEICQEAWEETRALGCLTEALEGAKFGAYVHVRAYSREVFEQNGHAKEEQGIRYLSCSINEDGQRYKLLDVILGKNPKALEESKTERLDTKFKTGGFAHWLLWGIFQPRPIAVAIDFNAKNWRPAPCELYSHKLALTIELGPLPNSPEYVQAELKNVLATMKAQKFGPTDQGMDDRLENLKRMKDPQDEFYVSYMGKEIQSNLIIPARGRPGIAIELLLEHRVEIQPLDGADDHERVRLKLDEIIMMLVVAERLKTGISRRYAGAALTSRTARPSRPRRRPR